MGWSGDVLTRNSPKLGKSVLPSGILLPSNFLEDGTSSNAIITVSKEVYSLSRIIKLGPTHMSEIGK